MRLHPLTFAAGEAPAMSADDPAATVWPGTDGRPLVIARRLGEWCWFQLAGVASYRFPCVSADLSLRCEALPVAGAATEAVVDAYYRVVAPLALQVYGLESLHGTALGYPGGALLLCGVSGTGKSTLARALAERGAALLGDDGLVVEVGAGSETRVWLHPIPFALMLREPSAAHFGSVAAADAGAEPGLSEQVRSEQAQPTPPAVAVTAVVLLKRAAAGEVEGGPAVTRLSPREAFTGLLRHAYAFSLDEQSRKGRMLAAYLRFAGAVPVYGLRYPSGLERLDAAAEAVEAIAAGPPAGGFEG